MIESSLSVELRIFHARNLSILYLRWLTTRLQTNMNWSKSQTCFYQELLLVAWFTLITHRFLYAEGQLMNQRQQNNANDILLNKMYGNVFLIWMRLNSLKDFVSSTTEAPFIHLVDFWRQAKCNTNQLKRLNPWARARTHGKFSMLSYLMLLLISGLSRQLAQRLFCLEVSMMVPLKRS